MFHNVLNTPIKQHSLPRLYIHTNDMQHNTMFKCICLLLLYKHVSTSIAVVENGFPFQITVQLWDLKQVIFYFVKLKQQSCNNNHSSLSNRMLNDSGCQVGPKCPSLFKTDKNKNFPLIWFTVISGRSHSKSIWELSAVNLCT